MTNKTYGTSAMTDKIKEILKYTGTIGALVASIAYVLAVVVLVNGFETVMEVRQLLTFAILGAVAGLLIMFLLRSQGISLAKSTEESKKIMSEYYKATNKKLKKKSLHTIRWHVFWSTLSDVFFKAVTIAATTYFSLHVFISGNQQWGLVLMAISNLLMFACFGILSLAKAHDFYIEQHLEVIQELTQRAQEGQL